MEMVCWQERKQWLCRPREEYKSFIMKIKFLSLVFRIFVLFMVN